MADKIRLKNMDVKPMFAVALVACCMACSFMLKVYTNQTNVLLFNKSGSPELVNNHQQGLTDFFRKIKAEATTIKVKQQSEDLATRVISAKLYTDPQY